MYIQNLVVECMNEPIQDIVSLFSHLGFSFGVLKKESVRDS